MYACMCVCVYVCICVCVCVYVCMCLFAAALRAQHLVVCSGVRFLPQGRNLRPCTAPLHEQVYTRPNEGFV